MTNVEKIRNIVAEKGYITGKLLKENGIETWYITNMVKKGILERISRGIYISNDGVYDERFVFQYNNTKAIYSYSNALYLHDLTDYIPTQLEVTVYQGYNTHRFKGDIYTHYVKKSIYNLGIMECRSVFGNKIKTYDKERTLCDLIINRRNMESEVFKMAFQKYFNSLDKNISKLMKYAKLMGIETDMFKIIEVMN